MNRAILRISLACLAMFVLLLLNINYVQAFESNSLASQPGNIRVFDQQFKYQRGSIVADGDNTNLKIAESVQRGGAYHRYYPYGPEYAAITGYDSIYGQSGIEQAENKELAGTDPRLAVRNLTSLLTGKSKQGATVALTISPTAQNAAYQALLNDGGHPAAVVALNPETGAILAMASIPTYNPNELTTFNGAQLDKVDNELLRDPSQPLLNRAINATFPPGSSFKIVTSSAAFSQGLVANPNTNIPAPTVLTLPNGNLLHNDGDIACFNGDPTITEAFYLSCNTAFAKLGIKLTAPVLRNQSSLFGMNRSLNIPLSVSPSVLPTGNDWTDPSLTAFSAIGQYNDEVSPLQEAMFSAAIENGGKLMTPYMVQEVIDPADLSVIQSQSPSVLSQAVSPQVAGDVKSMMLQVTQNPGGTAYQTAGPPATSIVIYGKTGTAENGLTPTQSPDDAVFSCFVPAGESGAPDPIAVGVIVQGGGFGADAAAPIAVQIIKAYEARS
ncbi:MAG TPA: penicillin-binding transpeptidase domain-containing protein [Streptosporangiaceae bacterium]|nr:penicillin-binding transpeptidase domain-containing protein [Streptosporangiaceae bacterium]